jgi:hypothetical protein
VPKEYSGEAEAIFDDDVEGGTETEEEDEPKTTGLYGREAGSVVSQALNVNRISNANP